VLLLAVVLSVNVWYASGNIEIFGFLAGEIR